MTNYFRTPIQIRFNDIDGMGHVNNAIYHEYFDLARVEYFHRVLGEVVDRHENGLIIASVKVDFLAPVFLSDRISVVTRVVKLRNKSLEMVQQIVAENETEPRARNSSVMVCFDYKKNCPVEIPADWRKKFQDFEGLED